MEYDKYGYEIEREDEIQTITPVEELVPVSAATNAYELLDDVVAAIEEEPLRLFMDNWIMKKLKVYQGTSLETQNAPPACGTVACVAGWIRTLKRDSTVANIDLNRSTELVAENLILGDFPRNNEEAYNEHTEAERALGVLFHTFPDEQGGPAIGTKEYANEVITAIHDFQGRFETKLKARTFKE